LLKFIKRDSRKEYQIGGWKCERDGAMCVERDGCGNGWSNHTRGPPAALHCGSDFNFFLKSAADGQKLPTFLPVDNLINFEQRGQKRRAREIAQVGY